MSETAAARPPIATPSAGGEPVEVRSGSMLLSARWRRPAEARGAVVFAHCPACGDEVPLAEALFRRSLASLLPDLLLPAEAKDPSRCHDEEFISQRLRMAVRTVAERPDAAGLPLAVLGRGCAGDAALVAAGNEPAIAAVVAIDPPLLAPEPFLERVRVPVLVVAGPGDLGTPRGRDSIEALRRHGSVEIAELPSGSPRSEELPERIAEWLDRVRSRPAT